MHAVEALILNENDYRTFAKHCPLAKASRLSQGFVLVPLVKDLVDEIQKLPRAVRPIPELASGWNVLTPELAAAMEYLSKDGLIVYIETEYFGGQGNQGAAVWGDGVQLYPPKNGAGTINQALKIFGIHSENNKDEFDSLGLGRYRSTEKWAAISRLALE